MVVIEPIRDEEIEDDAWNGSIKQLESIIKRQFADLKMFNTRRSD